MTQDGARASVEQTELPAAHHSLDPIDRPELAGDRVEVGLHRPDGHEQLRGNLAVRAAASDEALNLDFTRRKRVDEGRATAASIIAPSAVDRLLEASQYRLGCPDIRRITKAPREDRLELSPHRPHQVVANRERKAQTLGPGGPGPGCSAGSTTTRSHRHRARSGLYRGPLEEDDHATPQAIDVRDRHRSAREPDGAVGGSGARQAVAARGRNGPQAHGERRYGRLRQAARTAFAVRMHRGEWRRQHEPRLRRPVPQQRARHRGQPRGPAEHHRELERLRLLL